MRGEEVSTYLEQKRLMALSRHDSVGSDIYVSIFEGLSLLQYRNARTYIRNKEHKQPCNLCTGFIKAADEILEKGFMKLKLAFTISSPDVTYKASEARRKLLRMPLACVSVGDKSKVTFVLFLVEKQSSVDYTVFQTLLTKSLDRSVQNPTLSKQELDGLLNLTETDAAREMLKHVTAKASGLSDTKAKKIYGFTGVHKREQKVEEAIKESLAIRQAIEKIANLKDKALLSSLGFQVSSESEPSESESESEDDSSELSSNDENRSVSSCVQSAVHTESPQSNIDIENGEHSASMFTKMHKPGETRIETNNEQCFKNHSEANDILLNSHELLDILKLCSYNWFEFVSFLQSRFSNSSDEALSQLLLEFGCQLSSLNLEESDMIAAERSREAFLLVEKMDDKNNVEEDIVSESDSSDQEVWNRGVNSVLGENGRKMILKRRERSAEKL